jgi:hypothetical protein
MALLDVAHRMPFGEVVAEIPADAERMDDEGMYLAFNRDSGLLVRYGYRELLRATFPHRPSPPAGECDWSGGRPWDMLESHGFPREEAFALLRLYLATGELSAAVPRTEAEYPRRPGEDEPGRRNGGGWRGCWPA